MSRQLAGLQDEEQEAQEGTRGRVSEAAGEQFAGAWCGGGGSLMTAIRNPAAVKASVIACSGRVQARRNCREREACGSSWHTLPVRHRG